uniref:Uncharacterized protein n=1 Tax=Pseudonaja textilis TaxID=8673 RepID=A0A670YJ32_PSETE
AEERYSLVPHAHVRLHEAVSIGQCKLPKRQSHQPLQGEAWLPASPHHQAVSGLRASAQALSPRREAASTNDVKNGGETHGLNRP